MHADTVLEGRVFTADPDRPLAEAVAISGGRVAAVGSRAELEPLKRDASRVIDVGEGLVIPGMCDAHMHLSQGAVASMFQADLSGARTVGDYAAILDDFIRSHPGRSNYQGYGWDDAVFEAEGIAPDRRFLDDVSPEVPLFMRSYDGHSLVANTAAMELAGIGRGYASSQTGSIELDSSGAPTGLFREWTMRDIMGAVEPFGVDDYIAAIGEAQRRFLRVGVTSVFEPIIDNGDAVRAAYRALDRAGALQLKVATGYYTRPEAGTSEDVRAFARALGADSPRDGGAGRVRHGCVKILLDGVVEGRTAYLHDDYADGPGYRGMPICSPEELRGALRAICELGLQVHMHAIGDAAVSMALDGLEEVFPIRPRPDWRPTITHLQLVRPEDVERMARLGVVASANPVWHEKEPGYYGNLALPYLGAERAEHEYPLADLMRAGIPVSMGTDWPVSDPDPLLGIEVGVTRCMPGDASGETCLWPEQRASVGEMLVAATAGGAYQNFMERETGSIRAGLAADVCVLDRDITRIEPSRIHEARCLLTMVDGSVVWDAGRDSGDGGKP